MPPLSLFPHRFFHLFTRQMLCHWLLVPMLLGVIGVTSAGQPPDPSAEKLADDLAEQLRKLDARVVVLGTVRQPPLASILSRDVEARLRTANRAEAQAWQQLKTRADWERFRDARLQSLRASLGDFPPVPRDLKVRVKQSRDGDGYRVDNLIYQSRPGLLVTANLYRPAKPTSSMPGVVICHSHHQPKHIGARQDMGMTWAYDAAKDRWQRLAGQVPTGAYLTADLAPEKRLLLLVTNTRAPNHGRSCDVHYAVRTTYSYRLDDKSVVLPDKPGPQQAMPKRPAGESGRTTKPDPERQKTQAERLRNMPINQWVPLVDPGRVAPVRSWGSAAFDSDRGRILYWGGGHCSYGGSEVDAYDVATHTWVSSAEAPEYPHRLWACGVRLAGVTFGGNPWTEHGRRVCAYDPTSRKIIAVRSVLLTTSYEPACLRDFPGEPRARVDAKVKPPTTYSKYVTWSFDPDSGRWDVIAPAPVGLDTLVATKHGVLGVTVDWPIRLNDAGYLLPWSPDQPEKDNAVYLFEAGKRGWKRLGAPQMSPQKLYEMTSLTHDSKRDRLLLHGGGKDRDELWAFDLKTHRWQNLRPKVSAPAGAVPPVCNREAVYLPEQDVLLTYGPAPGKERQPALWAYRGEENAWYRIALDPPAGIEPRNVAGQNRALVYDPVRDRVLLVVAANDRAEARVCALCYRHDQAKRVEAKER